MFFLCFLGYNLLRTIYDDNMDRETEIQIDGKMFEGMAGRVLFSKVKIFFQSQVLCTQDF